MNDYPLPARPARLAQPPAPPPPASGNVERHGVVEILGPSEALTVGPDEVLVVVVHDYTDRWNLQQVRERMRDAGLREDQILLFGGYVSIGKAPKGNVRVEIEGYPDDRR